MPAGDCYFGEYPRVSKPHLYIQLSAVSLDGQIAVVNISTERRLCDSTCLLQAGDHPRIVHPSYVFYEKARFITTAQLVKLVDAHFWSSEPRLSPKVFENVLAGLFNSDDTPEEIKIHVKNWP